MTYHSFKRLAQFTGASILTAGIALTASEAHAISFSSSTGTFDVEWYTPSRTPLLNVNNITSTAISGGRRYDFGFTFSGQQLAVGSACPAGQVCATGSFFVTSGVFQRTLGGSQGAGTPVLVNSLRLTNTGVPAP